MLVVQQGVQQTALAVCHTPVQHIVYI